MLLHCPHRKDGQRRGSRQLDHLHPAVLTDEHGRFPHSLLRHGLVSSRR